MSGEAAGGDELPFRYGARLAAGIERHWQERWAAEGTFYTPNPAASDPTGFGTWNVPSASHLACQARSISPASRAS